MKAILSLTSGGNFLVDVPEDRDWKWYANTIGSDYIEIVHPEKLPRGYAMIVDEEGLLNEKPVNIFGSWLYGTAKHGQPIVGDLLIMKESYGADGIDHVGMTDDDIMSLIDRLNALNGSSIEFKN